MLLNNRSGYIYFISAFSIILFTYAYSDDSTKKDAAETCVQKIKSLKSELQQDANNDDVFDRMEQAAQEFYQSYPDEMKQPMIYEVIAETAQNYDVERAKKLFQKIEIIGNGNWGKLAAIMLRRLSLLGKPVYMHFNSVDGHSVDLTTMKGKVVLVDFWATTSNVSMQNLPIIKQIYDKYHEKGL